MKFFLFIIATLYAVNSFAGPHTVQKGETWEDIAKLYNVFVTFLKHENEGVELTTGVTIEVPHHSLVYDLGDSDLFRQVKKQTNLKKATKIYEDTYKKQQKLVRYSAKKKAKVSEKITENYLKAAALGSTEALYQLGKYKIHGFYETGVAKPRFGVRITDNLDDFTKGVEYLQIAALLGHKHLALIELAIACGDEASPIRNPYLCLGMLESNRTEGNEDFDRLLCYMYEEGYGISKDYYQAYRYCPSKEIISDSGTETHRERILQKIEGLPENFKTAKYGVGLDSDMLLTIGLSHYKEKVLDPQGIFWLHRAARKDNADANWILAGFLENGNYAKGEMGPLCEKEDQKIRLVRRSASLGNENAQEYLDAYEEYQRQKEEYERQKREEEERIKEAKQERRRAIALSVIGAIVDVAAQTYAAVETVKYQQSMNGGYYNMGAMPQMSFGQMSDAEFQARNQLAMNQIMQYTINQTYASMTNTPMIPTDMSAVNLGTDMSPGSPLWMWGQQQQINQMEAVTTRMRCEEIAFYREQADRITEHMMNSPLTPINGYVDLDGNWISAEMVAAGNDLNHESGYEARQEENQRRHEETRQKYHDYYTERYGDVKCHLCHGTGTCQTCNGTRTVNNSFGTGLMDCPNCWIGPDNKRSGLCSHCQGKGYVYGLK